MSHSDQSSNDSRSPEGAWEKLSRVAVKGAEYNSRERQPHAKCSRGTQGTRGHLLDEIYGLLDNTEKSRLIWLHGATGVGKSAVAFTVAERMKGLQMKEQITREKRLAGTFFFSRKYSKRCTAGYFFATLAYQLACNFPTIRDEVKRAVSDNPALLDPDKSLPDQMEELFLQPLRSLRFRLRQCPSVVFVVDALHECTSRAEIADLIFLLGQALREPDLPVTHILLTSVSEPHIHNVFQNKEVHPLVCEIPARISAEGIAIIVSLDGADADNDTHVFSEHSSKEPITSSQQLRFEGTSQFPSHSLQRASSFQEFERSYSPQLLHPSSHSSDSDQRRRVDSAGDERRPIVVGAPDHRLDSYHQPRANSADDEERPAVIRVAPEHRLHPYHRPRLNSADDEETPTIMVVPPEHQQSDHRPRVNSTVDEGRPIVDSVVPEHRIHSYQRLRANSAGDEQRSIVVLPPQQVQPPQNVVQHNGDVHFQYSTCTGRKKALCVGINYKGQRRELQGCINDVHNMKRFLTSHWGYREGDVVTLIDDTNNPRQMPTRRNILDAMRWLVKDAHPHDTLFFHYSGHGGQYPGENEDEIDELIYPVDYKKAGNINDNDMYRIMVKSLPVGCRLTAIFDSFHLGTALNLPYIYLSDGRPRINPRARAQNATGADVISLAACRAGQTSADYGMAIGTISCAFIMSLTRNPEQSYKELLKSVGDITRQQYQQEPQLSSPHTIDIKLRFIF